MFSSLKKFFSYVFLSLASFFGDYFYGDYKESYDYQWELHEEPQILLTTTALPPVVTENLTQLTPNSSNLEPCSVLFSFEPFVRRSCLAQFAEIPIDLFSLIQNYAFYFWATILLEEVSLCCYWIIKWWKRRRQTRERVAENRERTSPGPAVAVPKLHPSPIPGFFERASIPENNGILTIHEFWTIISFSLATISFLVSGCIFFLDSWKIVRSDEFVDTKKTVLFSVEYPIDSFFAFISKSAFGFWAIISLEEVLFGCYWIAKWWKQRPQRFARNHEPTRTKPLVSDPHYSSIPGCRRRNSLQDLKPDLSPIREPGEQPGKISSFLKNSLVKKLKLDDHREISDPFDGARRMLESENGTSSNGTNLNGRAGTLKVEPFSDTSSESLSSTASTLDPPLPKPKPDIPDIILPCNPQTFTVVVLGETGVGKSTLICSLANYAKWPNFEVAKGNFNNLEVCIPVRFDITQRDGKPTETVSVGEEFNENENFNVQGHSVTQMPKIHECTFGRNRLRIIDTPGLNDTRGMKQDERNLDLIKEIIHNQQEIHAIILVVKSNDGKLKPEFELSARNLLSIFPKSAVNNLFFFFTHSICNFFAIGNVMNLLTEFSQKFEKTHSMSLALTPDRTFCVDSESFRYLLAKHKGITYSYRGEKEFCFSWNESASSITEFINVIEGITPIKNEEIVSANEFVKEAIKFCDSYENNGLNLSDDEKPEFNSNLADFLKSVLNKAMPIEAPKLKRILALLNCGSVLNDNDEIRKRIKKLAKRAF